MDITSQNKPSEYFAFISYKREDEKWANWLQKKLESYSLPTAIRKEKPELPNKIRPVFRDQSELSGGKLKAEIEKGLNSSKYLIVICSPRSAKSPWVSKEVQHFIDQGREEYIIPFIIGGIPNAANPEDECFPEGLRQLTGEKEILGININEMGRDAAAIKVIARMFNLRFDSLWQRDRRNAKKRTLIVASGLLTVILITFLFIIVLLKKNSDIRCQNDRLDSLVASLKEENNTFSQIRDQTERYTYSGAIRGNDSDEWLMQIVFHPTDPIIAFSDDWGFWLHYIKTNTEILLPGSEEAFSTMNIDEFNFSEDGSKLRASSWAGLFIWSVDDHKLINHWNINQLLESDPDTATEYIDYFPNGVELDSTYIDHNSIYRYRFSNNNLSIYSPDTVLSTIIESERIKILENPVYDEILFVGMTRAVLFDKKLNQFVQFFRGYEPDFSFSSNGDYLRICKDVFERNLKIDTIQPNQYSIRALEDFPHEDLSNKLDITENDEIKYHLNGKPHIIEVIKNYTTGNGQEYLSNAMFATPNRIVAIVNQGKHRVYKADSGELIGTLTSYIWDGNESYGREQTLSHAESYIAYSKIIGKQLYVVSSGGIIRIYDIDKLRLIKLIDLPYKNTYYERLGAIDKCYINNDGSKVSYSFDRQCHFYDVALR